MRMTLQPGQWRAIGLMAVVVLALHVIGFVLLIALVVPHHYKLGASGAFAIGTGVTAYTLGMRHAFDADHIAAIDSTTRKLMADGQRPTSVGFFFSLGHSTVVFVLARLFSIGIKALNRQVSNGDSTLHGAASWIGTGVSGTFLYLIAALNLVILLGILKVFRQMRSGTYDEAELEAQLDSRGLMNRFLGRFVHGRCIRWGSCSVWASIRQPRSRCCSSPLAPRAQGCRSMRSSACRSCSRPACRCSTQSMARS
jgi:high-affinity nickel-transport protein